MPLISLITPAAPSALPYIAAAAESIRNLKPVDGFDLEWLITVDGDPCSQKDDLVDTVNAIDDLDVKVFVNPFRMWGGFSRNRGLVHASGDNVALLDADDVLTDTALVSWATHITERPSVQWCSYSMTDFYEDGTLVEFATVWDEGPVPAKRWLEYYKANGKHPRCPVSMLYRRDLLLGVGGWGAAAAGNDAYVTLNTTSRADGWCSHDVTGLYRKHADQITNRGDGHPLNALWADTIWLAVAAAERN